MVKLIYFLPILLLITILAHNNPQDTKKPQTIQTTQTQTKHATQKPSVKRTVISRDNTRPETIRQFTRRRTIEEFGAGQFEPMDKLITSESGWDRYAQNPGSTAFGLMQFLDGTWKTVGYHKTTDAHKQIEAGLIYIKNRYKTPARAWKFKQKNGWY